QLYLHHALAALRVLPVNPVTTGLPTPTRAASIYCRIAPTTQNYPLSLHDALPIFREIAGHREVAAKRCSCFDNQVARDGRRDRRWRAHASELRAHLKVAYRVALADKCGREVAADIACAACHVVEAVDGDVGVDEHA